MKQGTLFYDKELGRNNFYYDDEGEPRNYGGIHWLDGLEARRE